MKRAWVPLLTLVAGLAATALVTWLVANYFAANARIEFNKAVGSASDAIVKRIDSYIALLRGCSGLFAVQRQVSPGEFRAFVDRLGVTEFYRGVQGIGYAAQARPEDLEPLVARMRAQGFPEFRVWPEGAREEFFPILFLVPLDRRNQAAIGYDMFSESVRRAAMERARDQGMPAASRRVTLVQEIEGPRQAGFLIYVPVYREGDIPETQAERRSTVQGFAYSPFRADDLMREILTSEWQRVFRLKAYDGDRPVETNLLHASNGGGSERGRFRTTSIVQVAGQPWTLQFDSQPEFEARAHGGRAPLLVFFVGVALSLVLFYFTNSEARARLAAEQSASRLKRSREALRESEERLRLIVESARDYGIMAIDPSGVVTMWNAGAEQIFGYSAAEMIGRNLDLIFLPEDRAAGVPQREIAEALETGRAEDDRWHIAKGGQRRFITGVVRAIRDEFGNVHGLIKVTRDITGRREIEERVRREKEFSDAIIQSLPGVFYVFDHNGRFIRANPMLEKVTGYSAGEISDMRPEDLIVPEHRAHINERIKEVFTTGFASAEADFLVKDGRRIPYFFTGSRVEIDGRICLVGMGVDISERRRNEKALEEATKQISRHAKELEQLVAERTAHLEQSLTSLEGVLYHVAHDLRAPLRAMHGFTSILLKEYAHGFDAAGAEYARRISEAAARMDRLICDLLEYGRLGHAPLPTAPVPIEESVNRALTDLSDEIKTKAAEIKVDYPLPKVVANTTALDAILSNLLSNALKFVRADERPRVYIRADERDGVVRLAVEDNGIGIDPKYIDRVFRVFERLHTAHQYPGTGIGLAIVQKAVERMHGSVGVSSVPGQGTTFWVELPKG